MIREGGQRLDALRMNDIAGRGGGGRVTFIVGVTFWHPVSEKGFVVAIKWRALYDSIFYKKIMEKLSCKERILPPITEYPYIHEVSRTLTERRPQGPFLSPTQKDTDAGHLTVQYNTIQLSSWPIIMEDKHSSPLPPTQTMGYPTCPKTLLAGIFMFS